MSHELFNMNRMRSPSQPRTSTRSPGWPRVDVVDSENAYEVHADVPGFTNQQLTVTFHDSVLKIEGKLDETPKEGGVENGERRTLRRERPSLSFSRSFRFDGDFDGDKLDANLKDGVLVVTLPKAETTKPRTIAVRS
ncbi:Hsp20/alpha crystallin family protein [Desulfobulbus sp. AH-315-M07]|nr:Hsp20/alpha crystallin family protein [Desulfobulbus sp. AH-315-M07]